MGISILQGAPFSDATPQTVSTVAGSAGVGNLSSRSDHTHQLTDSGWIAPTLLNSWVNYGAPFDPIGYRKIGGIVFMRGLAKNGTAPGTIFVLPVGYRTAAQLIVAVVTNVNTIGRMDLQPDGVVRMESGSNAWFSLVCSFAADA